MAKVSAATFKTQMATAATALTTAFKDSVLTELAGDFKNPLDALRKLEKLFTLNSATGVFTSNDDYIDDYYAGTPDNKGSGVSGFGSATGLSVSSATLETAAPKNIVITLNKNISDFSHIEMAGAAASGKTIETITLSGTVLTITTDVAFIAADVVTISGVIDGVELNNITLSAQAITNNIV